MEALIQEKLGAERKAVRMFHASMVVTRIEEWCVAAESAEEARELLEGGQGHRCHLGDCLHVEVEKIHE